MRPHSTRFQSPAQGDRIHDLFLRYRAGDRAARDQLITQHMPLARRLAARYRSPHESFEDLIQVAMVGLIGAVDRFDPDRATSFASFAVPTILGELKRHFRNTAWAVHVPRAAQELSLRIDHASRGLAAASGRAPTVPELAQYLELDIETVIHGLDVARAHHADSLDAPVGQSQDDNEREPLAAMIGDEDERLGLAETRISLSSAAGLLPHRERQALGMRVNEHLRQTEIADRLGCSQMQVSRLLRRAADRLRAAGAITP